MTVSVHGSFYGSISNLDCRVQCTQTEPRYVILAEFTVGSTNEQLHPGFLQVWGNRLINHLGRECPRQVG